MQWGRTNVRPGHCPGWGSDPLPALLEDSYKTGGEEIEGKREDGGGVSHITIISMYATLKQLSLFCSTFICSSQNKINSQSCTQQYQTQ